MTNPPKFRRLQVWTVAKGARITKNELVKITRVFRQPFTGELGEIDAIIISPKPESRAMAYHPEDLIKCVGKWNPKTQRVDKKWR